MSYNIVSEQSQVQPLRLAQNRDTPRNAPRSPASTGNDQSSQVPPNEGVQSLPGASGELSEPPNPALPLGSILSPPNLVGNPAIRELPPDIESYYQSNSQLFGGRDPRQERQVTDLPAALQRQPQPLASSQYVQDVMGRINAINESVRQAPQYYSAPTELLDGVGGLLNDRPSDRQIPQSFRNVPGALYAPPIGDVAIPSFLPNILTGIGEGLNTSWDFATSLAADVWNLLTGQTVPDPLATVGTIIRNPQASPAEIATNIGLQAFPNTVESTATALEQYAPVEDPDAVSGYQFNPIRGYFGEFGRGTPGAAFYLFSLPENLLWGSVYSVGDTIRAFTEGNTPYTSSTGEFVDPTTRDGFGVPFYRYAQAFGGQDLDLFNFRGDAGDRYLSAIPTRESGSIINPGEDPTLTEQVSFGVAGFAASLIFGDAFENSLGTVMRRGRDIATVLRRSSGLNVLEANEVARRLETLQDYRRNLRSVPNFRERGELPVEQPGQLDPSPWGFDNNVPDELRELPDAGDITTNLWGDVPGRNTGSMTFGALAVIEPNLTTPLPPLPRFRSLDELNQIIESADVTENVFPLSPTQVEAVIATTEDSINPVTIFGQTSDELGDDWDAMMSELNAASAEDLLAVGVPVEDIVPDSSWAVQPDIQDLVDVGGYTTTELSAGVTFTPDWTPPQDVNITNYVEQFRDGEILGEVTGAEFELRSRLADFPVINQSIYVPSSDARTVGEVVDFTYTQGSVSIDNAMMRSVGSNNVIYQFNNADGWYTGARSRGDADALVPSGRYVVTDVRQGSLYAVVTLEPAPRTDLPADWAADMGMFDSDTTLDAALENVALFDAGVLEPTATSIEALGRYVIDNGWLGADAVNNAAPRSIREILTDITGDRPGVVDEAIEDFIRAGGWIDPTNFPNDDVADLVDFYSGNMGYRVLNGVARGDITGRDVESLIYQLVNYGGLTYTEALNFVENVPAMVRYMEDVVFPALPSNVNREVVYRGLRVDPENYEDFMRQHTPGQAVTYPSLTSTTTSSELTVDFSRPRRPGQQPVIQIIEDGESGRWLFNDAELEYLFPRRTNYEVTGIERNVKIDEFINEPSILFYDEPVTIIRMREVAPNVSSDTARMLVEAQSAARYFNRGLQELQYSIVELKNEIGRTLRGVNTALVRQSVIDEVAFAANRGNALESTQIQPLFPDSPLTKAPHELDDVITENDWFHGTRQTNMNVNFLQGGSSNEFGLGLYMTNNPILAQSAARALRDPSNINAGTTRLSTGRVFTVTPEITNVLHLDVPNPVVRQRFANAITDNRVREEFLELTEVTELREYLPRNYWNAYREAYYNARNASMPELEYRRFSEQIVTELRRLGYDGLFSEDTRTLVALPRPDGRVNANWGILQDGIVPRDKAEAAYARYQLAAVSDNALNDGVSRSFRGQAKAAFNNALLEDALVKYNELATAADNANLQVQRLQEAARREQLEGVEARFETAIRESRDAATNTPEMNEQLIRKMDDPCV